MSAFLYSTYVGIVCDPKWQFCLPFLLGKNSARRNLRYFTTSQIRPEASEKKAQKGPSTHVIGNTSFLEIAIDSKKADVSSNFSSYQTLTTDVNSRRNYARTKLNE
jgi:hypothetical protein